MAKDPAFLFFPGDWLGGTMTFSRSHKGAYMDLLMGQFNQGHMALHEIRTILGEKDFDEMWESKLRRKFKQDEDGLFYNQKLENEIIKRKKFTESRRKNLFSDKQHKAEHMATHMENENINGNKSVLREEGLGEGGWNPKPGKKEMNMLLDPVKGGAVIELFRFTKNCDLKQDELDGLWSVFKKQNFTGQKFYHSQNDIFSHFINWSKSQKIENGTAHKQIPAGSNGKLGTSEARVKKAREW
jgi:hypothetical protein